MHVVLGTGPLGTATAEALVASGRARVRMVSRTSHRAVDGAEVSTGDLRDAPFARSVGADAEAIYFCAAPKYHRWSEEFPALQAGAVAAAQANGAHLVCVENLYLYGDPAGRALEETDPLEPSTKKGRVRAEMAEALSAEHATGRLRVSHVRPSDLFGPRVHDSALGREFFVRIARGKTPRAVGDLDAPHTWSFVPDVGRTLAHVGLERHGDDEVWHVPSPEPISFRRLAVAVSDIVGERIGISATPRWLLASLGLVVPPVREMIEMLYQFERPFVMNSARTQRALGIAPTPLEDAVRQTLAAAV